MCHIIDMQAHEIRLHGPEDACILTVGISSTIGAGCHDINLASRLI
jgi:hypothetical protein